MLILENTPISKEMEYHLNKNIPITKTIFRYGSDSWSKIIREARNLYNNGYVLELDEEEYYVLTSNIGEVCVYEGNQVFLETPQFVWDKPGYFEVYLYENNNIIRVEFKNEASNS